MFFVCLFFQTASFLGPMAQMCHRYSNLAHTIWVDLFPQLWNLLTDKQQQVSLQFTLLYLHCKSKTYDFFIILLGKI